MTSVTHIAKSGGPGNDTLDLSQIAGNFTANLAQDTLVGGQIGFSVLNSIENIIAGSGNERLIGSSGANVFQTGAGTDTLTGNGGGDTFVFKPGFDKAVITDFHVATTRANPHDVIELDHSIFSQFATIHALLASAEVTQSGSSVVIAADATHTIELQHTSLRMLAGPFQRLIVHLTEPVCCNFSKPLSLHGLSGFIETTALRKLTTGRFAPEAATRKRRPLLSTQRTKVGHRAMSDMCQKATLR